MASYELGFEVDIDALLNGVADRAVLAAQACFLCAGDEGCYDFALMVDEPLDNASSRWTQDAEASFAIAQGVLVGPLVVAKRE